MTKKITKTEIEEAAKELVVEPCTIKAVSMIESNGKGFTSDGKPTVRFEKHVFRRELKRRGLGWPVEAQGLTGTKMSTVEKAANINEEAAFLSTSWGLFQIMGFNYIHCGYKDVETFVEDMKTSEGKQLAAFVSFLKNQNLAKHLRKKEWASFAYLYNGPNYHQNDYHKKLRLAYLRCIGG